MTNFEIRGLANEIVKGINANIAAMDVWQDGVLQFDQNDELQHQFELARATHALIAVASKTPAPDYLRFSDTFHGKHIAPFWICEHKTESYAMPGINHD